MAEPGCSSFPGGNCGVFTSVTGTAPNRIFNIEWRTVYFADNSSTANFRSGSVRERPNKRFDVIYGATPTATTAMSRGVQAKRSLVRRRLLVRHPTTLGGRLESQLTRALASGGVADANANGNVTRWLHN